MKKLICALLLAVPLLAWPGEAKAWHYGSYQLYGGFKVWVGVRSGVPGGGGGGAGGPAQAGPWYLYWPMEAHFQVPAPGASPYFGPMTLPPSFGGGGYAPAPYHYGH